MPTSEQNTKPQNPIVQLLKAQIPSEEWPKEGGVVDATLIKKLSREAQFDLGRFGTGIVFGIEFSNAKEILRGLNPGDKIAAKIVAVDGEKSMIELSLTEAGKQKLWQEVKELAEAGEVIKVKISGANAGGLTAQVGDLDVKAFMPVSQLSVEHYPRVGEDRAKIAEELKKFVGQELSVKIIDLNPRSNKIILSEREAYSANLKDLLAKYSVGNIVDGTISGVADFGVFVRFVDNPDVEGMIHISELAHRIVDNPKEIVKVGDQIKVKILEIKDDKVFLSLKSLEADPWLRASDLYKPGQEVSGTVYKLNPFGAVINLDGGLQGLIHISEFGGQEEMKVALQPSRSADSAFVATSAKEAGSGEAKNTPYKFVVDSVKPEEKRIILKLKK